MAPCRLALVGFGCLALGLMTAAAEESAMARPLTMEQVRMMDADKDGLISQEEYARHSRDLAAWLKMDANRDRVLDQDEQLNSIRPEPTTRRN